MDPANDTQVIAAEAEKTFGNIIERIAKANESSYKNLQEPQDKRLFFPNGIELLYLKFKVGEQVDITIAVAGKDAPVKIGTTFAANLNSDGGWVSSG
ncbi:hypothetical protein [Paraburkholderia sp. GAS32]|uniref:hypothetical protein n=1 Tax=Paraburkholderia sp. GAS32 TaxID=3035129 RepID=UPI003D1903F2